MVALGLTRVLERASIPIVGVSVGRATDRATWIVRFKPNATDKHKADAAAIVAGYDVTADTALRAELADKELGFKVAASLARATWENLPSGKPSWLDFLSRWKAIYLAK